MAVLLALVHLGWLQLRPGSAFRQTWTAAANSGAGRTTQPDASLADAGDDGNLLLQLAGYTKTNRVIEKSIFYYYFHTTYALYPRRLYVAPADKIIISGLDIMDARFHPDPNWLREHQVRYRATFGGSAAGGTVSPWETPPPDDGTSGTQTNRAGGDR
jgi:hypothetical protein